MTAQEIREALCEAFPESEVEWLVICASKDGQKALVAAYVDARVVQDRLDAVFGVEGWQDHYTPTENGCVICTLSVKIDGEWIDKTDAGRPSKQLDPGDKFKAAFSDALKRTAVKLGIGRYLARVPQSWVAYDSQYKKLKERPKLPDWALPRKKGAAPKTQTPAAASNGPAVKQGADLRHWILQAQEEYVKRGACAVGELMVHMIAWARSKGQARPDSIDLWPAALAAQAGEEMKAFYRRKTEEKAKAPAAKTQQTTTFSGLSTVSGGPLAGATKAGGPTEIDMPF